MRDTKIFIIDADPVQGNYLKYCLNSLGIRNSRLFISPADCLECMSKEGSPFFIVADTALKNFSDIELTKHISKSHPETRLVYYSDTDDPAHAEQLFSLGVTDFILKSKNNQGWFKELAYNIRFLLKESIPAGRNAD